MSTLSGPPDSPLTTASGFNSIHLTPSSLSSTPPSVSGCVHASSKSGVIGLPAILIKGGKRIRAFTSRDATQVRLLSGHTLLPSYLHVLPQLHHEAPIALASAPSFSSPLSPFSYHKSFEYSTTPSCSEL